MTFALLPTRSGDKRHARESLKREDAPCGERMQRGSAPRAAIAGRHHEMRRRYRRMSDVGAGLACCGCSCSEGASLAAARCSIGSYLARSTRVAISASNPSRIASGSDASLASVAMLIQRLLL